MKKILSILLVCMMIFTLVGCGTKTDQGTESTESTAKDTDTTAKENFKVILVVTGQLGDKSFNDSAAAGIEMIKDDSALNVETKVIEIGRDQTQWEPTFTDLAEAGDYNVIVTNGSNAKETVVKVAGMYPEQKFIMYDTTLKDEEKLPNIYAMSYKQNEASYLGGVLAASVSKTGKIGFLGGSEHPVISDFLVGYIEGALSVNPDVEVYVGYIGSWSDTAAGKTAANAQLANGVDVLFPAAETAGLGAIEATKDAGKLAIGVDSDQAMLYKGTDEAMANTILSSVLKNVGDSIYRAISLEVKGELKWADYEVIGVADGGTGLADNEYFRANVPVDVISAIKKAEKEITDGSVTVSTALGVDQTIVDAIIDSAAPGR